MDSMPAIRTDSQIVVAGLGGMGKTYLVKELLKRVDTNKKIIYYDPFSSARLEGYKNLEYITPSIADIKDVEALAKRAIYAGNTILVIDEAHLCVSSKVNIGQDQKGDIHYPFLTMLIQGCRHFGCGLVTISRRFTGQNTNITCNAHHYFIFRQHFRNDLEALKEWLPHGNNEPVDFVKFVRNAKRGYFVWFSDAGIFCMKPIKSR